MVPNGGTLLLILILVLTARVWAKPLLNDVNAPGPSATTVNYQGRLADPAGNPLDGTYGMEFAIYDAASGGTLIWGPESHSAVPVTDGLFSVGLGSQTSGGIPTTVWDGDRYLEITVGGETLSPRELVRSVPIAGMALTVPDEAIKNRNVALSAFSAYQETAVPVGSEPTEVLSLDVAFPLDATYVIFVKVSSTYLDTAGGNSRIISHLEDENEVDLPGSVVYTYHCRAGDSGTHTGSVSLVHNLTAGAHTIRLLAIATGDGSGTVRSAHIIAIPFAQAP